MEMSSFDILELIIEQFKQKPYNELAMLAEKTILHSDQLPANTILYLIKTVNNKNKHLKFVLHAEFRKTLEEHEEFRNQSLQSYKQVMEADLDSESEIKKELKKYKKRLDDMDKHMVDRENPNLFNYGGYDLEFEATPDNNIIEDEFTRNQRAEDEALEEAEWFGKTGLSDEAERHLARYLRLEFGEFLLDEDSLKANDLKYLGRFELTETDKAEQSFADNISEVYCWLIPSSNETIYAYIEQYKEGALYYSTGTYLPEKAR